MSTRSYRNFCMDSQCLLGDCGPTGNNRTTEAVQAAKMDKMGIAAPRYAASH